MPLGSFKAKRSVHSTLHNSYFGIRYLLKSVVCRGPDYILALKIFNSIKSFHDIYLGSVLTRTKNFVTTVKEIL